MKIQYTFIMSLFIFYDIKNLFINSFFLKKNEIKTLNNLFTKGDNNFKIFYHYNLPPKKKSF